MSQLLSGLNESPKDKVYYSVIQWSGSQNSEVSKAIVDSQGIRSHDTVDKTRCRPQNRRHLTLTERDSEDECLSRGQFCGEDTAEVQRQETLLSSHPPPSL